MIIIPIIHTVFIIVLMFSVKSEKHGRWLLRWAMNNMITFEVLVGLFLASTLGAFGGVLGVSEASIVMGMLFIANRIIGYGYRNIETLKQEWNNAPD